MVDFETSSSKSEVSKSNSWKTTSFLKTMALQREPFLTMFYTINLSPLRATQKGFMLIIILSNYSLVSTALTKTFIWCTYVFFHQYGFLCGHNVLNSGSVYTGLHVWYHFSLYTRSVSCVSHFMGPTALRPIRKMKQWLNLLLKDTSVTAGDLYNTNI